MENVTDSIKMIDMKKRYRISLCIMVLFFFNQSNAQTTVTLLDSFQYTTTAIKTWLSKQLPYKEVKRIAFDKMVVHYLETFLKTDTTHYYAKVPYRDTSINGFVLIQRKQGKFRYLKFHGDAYHYSDTLISNLTNSTWVAVSGKGKKKYRLAYNGLVTQVNNNPVLDSIYKYVPLITIRNQSNLRLISVLDVTLLFGDIEELNRQVQTTTKVVQLIIPFEFVNYPAIELEYDIY
jgi:hypothetical protein